MAAAASTTWISNSASLTTVSVDLKESMSVVGRFWINPTVSESIKCSFVSSIFNSLWRESTVANNSLATYVFEDVIFSRSVDLPAFV